MNQKFQGWAEVARHLGDMASPSSAFASLLNDGQRASLRAIAKRLPNNGVIVADEVGMGKTRIATALTRTVIEADGRVAILVPPGLGFQWGDELRKTGVTDVPAMLRSMEAYLNAWNGDEDKHEPWAERPALLISHAFCNWQVKSTTKKNWKWTLLPQTLAQVQARLRESGRMPRGTRENEKFDDKRVAAAAAWIACSADQATLNTLASKDKFSRWGRGSPLFKPENYLKNTEFRKGLESVVGLGLGEFDLIVIDEAHKSRGAQSNLNRLLEHIIVPSGASRRLALTATPIELDVGQWESTLKRIAVTVEQRERVVGATGCYVEAIRRLRLCWRTNSAARDEYRKAAAQFRNALSPYLLRRDKCEDEDVLKFKEASGLSEYDYRHLREVAVDFKDLSPSWRHVVCAAEALSVVREAALDVRTKRLRLTIGNGHGLAGVIDEAFLDKEDDKRQVEEDRVQAGDEVESSGLDQDAKTPDAKSPVATRSAWWASTLRDALPDDQENILFEHPAILAAVRTIEEETERGEKVLVFGRFTRPMRALVSLLNARQMLKAVEQDSPWPQTKVHVDEWPAVRAAYRQLSSKVDLNELDDFLFLRYRRHSDQRAKQREELLSRLRVGFADLDASATCLAIIDAIERQTAPANGDGEEDEHPVALLARAIAASTDRPDAPDADLAKAFQALVAAAADHDHDEEVEFDEEQAQEAWKNLEEHLRQGYPSQQGGFSRLMYGETKPQTRRMIQLAFNRANSFPRVLVAQSLVGREGLNLHESCRIVVLLHPEWNPGVVEQQIGRVDRVNSRWAKALRQAIGDGASGTNLPRIEIRPVIFKGTYDEHNWNVLQERWENLRAQLHGEAVPARLRVSEDAEGQAILDEIAADRPNFSPRNQTR